MPYVKQITIRSTLNRSLKYIVNDNKTDHGCLVTGVNCASNDKLAYKQMFANKKNHKKEKGTLGFHFMQSFKENEITDPYKAHEIGLKWAEKMFGDKYQYVLSTHIDKGHIHNHVVINSVSLSGKKFNACKQSLQDARDYSDEIAKEYSLSVIPPNEHAIPKSYKEWNEEKRGNSWKAHIKHDIDEVIKSSKSFEEFMQNMKRLGYTMKQGHVKYMTFKAPGMERSVRGKTLGPEYTEERIKERIQLREFNFVESKRKYKYRFNSKPTRTQIFDAARNYKYKRGSLAVNFMLTIALLRTLTNRKAEEAVRRNSRRDFSIDIEISKLSKQLQLITDYNLKSRGDLQQAIKDTEQRLRQINGVIEEANNANRNIILINQTIEAYNKHKPIYDEYKSATIRKMLVKKKYSAEIETFEKAMNQLDKLNIKEKDFSVYRERQKTYGIKIEQLKERHNTMTKELYKLSDIEKTLNQRNQFDLSKSKNNERDERKER
ncbi:relaxase/mobilization nuclease domain-containing protein [Paenibacillus peoriae]|uniref:relaxase/mobilization nuclease domain-containing protein n=2 Tax=Paenibacillus TaxID=44249 RepID=UPI00026C6878|nr:relaxase/mobilization nuclease domain-containing protein [Paenibacillus peoriae]MEC0182320.1 relaxase/mobilization nuclease domain-containing protein [Paenibacillus peoriae]